MTSFCMIDNDDCLGDVEVEDGMALCRSHWRERGELGLSAFEEWYSNELDALAAAARERGDVKQAPAESPQSGPEGATPNPLKDRDHD